jgi:molybdopterin-biosynthesis enzyme MoeA-like protein
MPESTLTPLMEAIEAEFALVKVFSLPHVGDDKTRRHIDLGVKGEPSQVEDAFRKMEDGLRQLKADYQQAS